MTLTAVASIHMGVVTGNDTFLHLCLYENVLLVAL